MGIKILDRGNGLRLDREKNIQFGDVKKEKIRTKEIAKWEAFLSVEPKSIASKYFSELVERLSD